MFTNAKWIWLPTEAPDTYTDFVKTFTFTGQKATLRISCDSNYVAYINGKLAAFGQYADYADHKIGDTVDVTEFVHEGENSLAVIVWYYGITGTYLFTYAKGRAGLIFELDADGETIAFSDEDTLCRPDPGYKQGRCSLLTSQVGLDFYRDEVNADDRFIHGITDGFAKSTVVVGAPERVYPRPNKKLILGQRQEASLLRIEEFEYPKDAESLRTADNMNYASLALRSMRAVSGKRRHTLTGSKPVQIAADGNLFLMVDLKRESVGFLDIDIELPHDCRIDIGWGEHLNDGRCRTAMRNFAVSIDAKAGRLRYMNPFRRFGCRYIQVFIHAKEATVHYIGVRPTDYPLTVKPFDAKNLLRNTIYDVCVDTLRLCMHEHYEDCPWREQSLYALDSRNQMLCGYYAFGEYQFPRASLHLLGEALDSDGLITICAPMAGDLKIPSFSLAYFLQMNEYIKYSGDTSLAEEMYGTLETIMQTFTSRIDEIGLARSFTKDAVHWNFYEWSDTLSGDLENGYGGYEAALNLMLALAMENYAELCRAIGKHDRAAELDPVRKKLCAAVTERFFDADTKLYHTSDEHTETYTVLVNSLALLTGAADGLDVSEILRILEANGKDEAGNQLPGIISNTLSMNCFRFDALLKYDCEKYKDVILNEIDSVYLSMLRSGATSFWETSNSEDFGGAVSYCHGWAALPIYYYSILL